MSMRTTPSERRVDRQSVQIVNDLESLAEVPRSGPDVLALGSDLKSTICRMRGRTAWVGSPIGNLTDPIVFRRFGSLVADASRVLGLPDIVACDKHPGFLSTQYARSMDGMTISVQHHHAHIAAVMAENGADSVVGVCCDGVGWGPDGAAWGCEILHCDKGYYERLGHLQYFSLFGNDAAAIETWRPAAALIRQAFGAEWRSHLVPAFERVPRENLDLFESAAARQLATIPSSSLGRVFDGVSFLLGLCDRNSSEARAAILLERTADSRSVDSYPYETTLESGSIRMSLAPAIRAMVRDINAATTAGLIAARFHETIARMLTASAILGCDLRNVETVALAGGCFANRRLLKLVDLYLSRRGVRILKNKSVSCGDAGLSLGQAYVAAQPERVV